MQSAARPLVEVGEVIADRYRIDRVLGQGAMGLVVAATHVELRKPRAIKFMLPDAMHGRESVERFLREARTASELRSQHAVKIHDVARLPTGEPYIVMEYLEGTDFRALLKLRRALPVHEAVTYMLQVCEAVAEAHAAGIVHRDLKPANLFLARGVGGAPCVKVLDFGIAKLDSAEGTADEVHLTRTDVILGSPLYMSPEQIISTRHVDGRSDIWSLGVILYSFVTGELPFRGESAQVVFAAVQRDPPPPPSVWKPDLPAELERIILRCLEKDPARRYATVGGLAADLSAFAAAAQRPQQSSPAPLEPADAQLPSAVWQSSSGQISFPYPAQAQPAAAVAAPASNGGTQVMQRSASIPGAPPGDPAPPAAQTNAPMVQSIAMTTPAPSRARGLLLAGGGFGLALLLVAVVMIVTRSGAAPTEDKQPAAAAPPTPPVATAPPEPAAPAVPSPVVAATTNPELANATGPAPAAPPTAGKTTTRTAPVTTTKATAPVTTAPTAKATATVKGPPVRRRDD